jgi:hypothetical protein
MAMSKVIVDDDLRAKLNGLNADVELCDSAGQPLADVVTPEEYGKLLYLRAAGRHSDEDVARLRQQTGGRTLPEIWKDLGAA